MKTLQVRELPEDIYYKLKSLAIAEHRSLAQETIVLLRKGLGMLSTQKGRRAALLDQISRLEIKEPGRFPSPVELVPEDRNR